MFVKFRLLETRGTQKVTKMCNRDQKPEKMI